MVLVRPGVLQKALTGPLGRTARPGRSSTLQVRHRLVQQSGRRAYADQARGATTKSSSDLPWLIGAIVVTIPSTWYVLQPSASSHHDDEHGHKEKGSQQFHSDAGTEEKDEEESSGEQESEEQSQEEGSEDEESSADDDDQTQSSTQAEKSSMPEEPEDAKTPDNKGMVEGVRFKGPTNYGGDDDNAAPDIRKSMPDSKGVNKKRIQSGYATPLGANETLSEDKEGGPEDKPSPAKEPLSQNHISGKQAGISNTETKHSTDINQNKEKSKKGEGVAETAKLMGTVDPNRPQA